MPLRTHQHDLSVQQHLGDDDILLFPLLSHQIMSEVSAEPGAERSDIRPTSFTNAGYYAASISLAPKDN